MIPRNEDMKKYENKDLKIKLYYFLEIDMKILLQLSFQNKGSDVLHFQTNVYFKNIKSLEGEIAPLKLKKKAKYIYLVLDK